MRLSDLQDYSTSQLSALVGSLSPKEQYELAELLEFEQRKEDERHADEIWAQCAIREAAWDKGPLLWLSAHTKTEDTHWMETRTEFRVPFPRREYLRVVMSYLLSEKVLFLPKSREMLMSWLVCGLITWECQWFPVFWVAQTGKEDKVAELIEYARTLVNNQPEWMRKRNPIVTDNTLELEWANGGRFLGVPKGADQIRIHHPKGYFQDESAFLPEAQQSFDAVRPVCRQLVCVSTDEMGWFHQECKLET